jgi:hypothetical protein
MERCFVSIDGQFSIIHSSLSFLPTSNRRQNFIEIPVRVNLLPFETILMSWNPVTLQTTVLMNPGDWIMRRCLSSDISSRTSYILSRSMARWIYDLLSLQMSCQERRCRVWKILSLWPGCAFARSSLDGNRQWNQVDKWVVRYPTEMKRVQRLALIRRPSQFGWFQAAQ